MQQNQGQPPPTPQAIAAASRTSKTHPINVSWLFPHNVLAPHPDAVSPLKLHPDKIVPRDFLDLLGVAQANYPNGRAPSSSGFIGGFPVAKIMNQNQVQNPTQPAHASSPNSSAIPDRTSSKSVKQKPVTAFTTVSTTATAPQSQSSPSLTLLQKPKKSPPTTITTTVSATCPPSSTEKTSATAKIPHPLSPAPANSPNLKSLLDSNLDPSRFESTHGREAIEEMEALGTDESNQPEEDACAVLSPQQSFSEDSDSAFVTLPNGVVIRGDDGLYYGNVALSSCPGKKVRLDTGPVNGRAAINRDLDSDFGRLASLNIKCVVCCLNDSELAYLGAPFTKYEATAMKYGMQIIRIPIIEGSCPDNIEEVSVVVEEIDRRLREGVNVLIHCRGGVGRAGLIACCLLLRKKFVLNATRAIQFVRIRRSLKAIETMRQEDFINAYEKYLSDRLTCVDITDEDNEEEEVSFPLDSAAMLVGRAGDGNGLGSSKDVFEECIQV
ncbi:UNVERIFIED_CONTAM: hypothetical protein HDU68_009009 [Siphonaria sp. JEL0065]|nr:hypothetical protein HDU68_009009 [Siphonaria sp. JEL0065]